MAADRQDDEQRKINRRRRSIALAIVLALVAVGFYALTIIKMGPEILQRPL